MDDSEDVPSFGAVMSMLVVIIVASIIDITLNLFSTSAWEEKFR
jgi:hypothetical protein